ncbi:MAG: CHAP domain-containing protein [Solirubrobacteraceae bacterium]
MKTELQGFLKRSIVNMPRRGTLWLAVLAACLAGLGAWATTAATADGTLLCEGYAGCSAGDFTTNGYAANADVSWWRMFAGVNCTNYAAYVESQIFGVPTPDYLLGNAGQWAANAAAQGTTVDQTPSVGAVAFWKSGTPGIGHYGHVGVVESVGPNDSYIDISQDNISTATDGYDWERIYPDGGSTDWEPWPSAFIHFSGTLMPSVDGAPDTGAGLWIAGAKIAGPAAS